MRSVLFLGFTVAVFALSTSDQALVDDVLGKVRHHAKTNFRFSELEAAVTLRAKEQKGQNAIQEIGSLTDTMIIQLTHEMKESTKAHGTYQANCARDSSQYAQTVTAKQIIQREETRKGDRLKAEWVRLEYGSNDGELLSFPPKKLQKQQEIDRTVNKLQVASDTRNKKHQQYLKALQEHQTALIDVKTIRLILQNSAVDNKARQGAQVSAGKTTAKVAGFAEIKKRVHPRLNSLVQLAEKVTKVGTGIDKVYDLLYQVRESLLASQNKLIKGEKQSISNWRTNKISFHNDINDLRFNKASLHLEQGTCKRKIGDLKLTEGKHRETSARAVKVLEDNTIMRNFLIAACQEESRVYSEEQAKKQVEVQTLESVQEALRKLKWSNKVFKSVAKVSAGVTWLNGTYNIRSKLDRYMIRSAQFAYFAPMRGVNSAEKLRVELYADDLSHKIISSDGKKTYYLTERSGRVMFTPFENRFSRWNLIYDKKSEAVFIRNKETRNTLFVDASQKYVVTTTFQTTDQRSQFVFEKPDYSVVGCFKNKLTKSLSHYAGAQNQMSTQICYDTCKKWGQTFTHFGLTEGSQCYCGTTYWTETAPDSDCGLICTATGDGDLCGGSKRTLIYKNTGGKPKAIIIV